MNNNTLSEGNSNEKNEKNHKVEIAINLDPQLLAKVQHLTNDPSKVIESALKQWLKGERQRDDDLTRRLRRNPPVPPRGEWND